MRKILLAGLLVAPTLASGAQRFSKADNTTIGTIDDTGGLVLPSSVTSQRFLAPMSIGSLSVAPRTYTFNGSTQTGLSFNPGAGGAVNCQGSVPATFVTPRTCLLARSEGSFTVLTGTGPIVMKAGGASSLSAGWLYLSTSTEFNSLLNAPGNLTISGPSGTLSVSGATTSVTATAGDLTLQANVAPNNRVFIKASSIEGEGDTTFNSSVTASSFWGNGAGITSYTVTASSEPTAQPSVATVSYIGVATMTATLRGSRPVLFSYTMGVQNSAGGSRDYTTALWCNDTLVDDEHIGSVQGGTGAYGLLTATFLEETFAAGATSCVLNVKSSNATGAQVARDVHVNLVEF